MSLKRPQADLVLYIFSVLRELSGIADNREKRLVMLHFMVFFVWKLFCFLFFFGLCLNTVCFIADHYLWGN